MKMALVHVKHVLSGGDTLHYWTVDINFVSMIKFISIFLFS